METEWEPTTVDVYCTIYGAHERDLQVFATCTDMTGERFAGAPYMLTEWGFRGANVPLIKSVRRGDHYDYFIARDVKREGTSNAD